jgi:hypothetical protein
MHPVWIGRAVRAGARVYQPRAQRCEPASLIYGRSTSSALIADLLVNSLGDADSAGLSQRDNSRRDIHAVAKYGVVREQYIADVYSYADSELRVVVSCGLERARN